MNETWQGITQLMGIAEQNTANFGAQQPDPAFQPVQPGRLLSLEAQELVQNLVRFILICSALLTLLVGLLIAATGAGNSIAS